MTRKMFSSYHIVCYCLAIWLQFTASSQAVQELTEPKASGSSSQNQPADLPTSLRLRKKLSQKNAPAKAPGIVAPKKSSQNPDHSESPGAAEPAPDSRGVGTSKPIADAGIRFVSEDPAPSAFFSAAVPRNPHMAHDATLNDVCHVGTICWAVGERGVVCFSNDAGTTWASRFVPIECSLRSVCFLTNKIGWIAGIRILPGTSQQSAVLLQTRDGGATWTDLSSLPSEAMGSDGLATSSLPGIVHVQFFGLQEAIAVTLPVSRRNGAGIFRTEDGGRSWSVMSADQPGSIWTDGAFLSLSEGIVVGQRQSYAAIVSDQTVVISAPQPTLRELRGVSLSTDGKGWIVGDGSMILKTANSGVTWEPSFAEIPREITQLTDLHTVAHQGSVVLLAGNPASILLRSTSGGQQWDVMTLPTTGRIHQLRFVSETDVLAVGSLGQILRSSDAGESWQTVRSADLRTGILNLVTDADKASWQLLANASAEKGVRSVVLQLSQPLALNDRSARTVRTVTSERSQIAASQIGGNESVADWMFPRTRPEHHRSAEQLIVEWNRQTDGQLRRLLPLRLARDLRNWKPSVIVIEPTADEDAVADITREIIERAMELASSDGAGSNDSELLSSIGLKPWDVQRVVSRAASNRQTALSYDDADLLPQLGTTNGLLCDAVTRVFPEDLQPVATFRTRASYELLSDRNGTAGLSELLEGLDRTLMSNAQRPISVHSREDVEAMKKLLLTAHIEGTAVQGHAKLGRAEESLTAELQTLGIHLPDSLAVKQLRDLAALNLQQNNMEGYLAVQQEVIRRYPNTEDGRNAAEMLFLFYSSQEARYFRLRTTSRSPYGVAVSPGLPSGGGALPGAAATPNGGLNDSNLPANATVMQPEIQAPVSNSFSGTASDPAAALQERWDSHAATALRILSTANGDSNVRRSISPVVQLRHAANQRLKNRSGEESNALAEVAQRDDEFGAFAKSEMQFNMAALSALPTFNLQRQTEPPFLDGKLSDTIWEKSEEISLRTFELSSNSVDSRSAGSAQRSRENEAATLAMLAWDEEFLYFAARIQRDPQKTQAVQLATHRSHDSRHGSRDRFELEIDTDRDFVTSFQLTVDESGLTSDRCWLLGKWNPQWYVAVDSDETSWRVEAAIPFSELASRPAKAGDLWSFKLRRIVPGVLQHELIAPGSQVSTHGTAMVRFIRPKVLSGSRSK